MTQMVTPVNVRSSTGSYRVAPKKTVTYYLGCTSVDIDVVTRLMKTVVVNVAPSTTTASTTVSEGQLNQMASILVGIQSFLESLR